MVPLCPEIVASSRADDELDDDPEEDEDIKSAMV